jgi:hypothetical protein
MATDRSLILGAWQHWIAVDTGEDLRFHGEPLDEAMQEWDDDEPGILAWMQTCQRRWRLLHGWPEGTESSGGG